MGFPTTAGGACKRTFQFAPLSLLACRMLRLLAGDSSISARIAWRSSVAETTGNNSTSTQPKASRTCTAWSLCLARAFPDLRHSQ